MKNTLQLAFVFVMLTVGAMGQTMQEQKACYVQAHKVASKGVVVSNHYDARTKTCWVKEFQITSGDESVYNAFEPGVSEAEFAGASANGVVLCFVHDTMCKNVAEFESLAKKRYGF